MTIIDLTEEQAEEIETRLEEFDEEYITYKMNGFIRIGMEDNGRLIAGLDACVTAFRASWTDSMWICPITSKTNWIWSC